MDEAATLNWKEFEANLQPDSIPNFLEDKSSIAEQVVTDDGVHNRRSQRRRFPSTFTDNDITNSGELVHFVFLVGVDTLTWKQALDMKEWKEAMIEELEAIEKNKTWELVDLPQHKHLIDVKWVFKTKYKPDGEVAKFKARLVAKGFLQKLGVDFTDVFEPVARLETMRLVVALANFKNWKICQMNVKSAFLNGPLEEEEVYVR